MIRCDNCKTVLMNPVWSGRPCPECRHDLPAWKDAGHNCMPDWAKEYTITPRPVAKPRVRLMTAESGGMTEHRSWKRALYRVVQVSANSHPLAPLFFRATRWYTSPALAWEAAARRWRELTRLPK